MRLMLAVFVAMVLGSYQARAQTKPKFFSSQTTCLVALRSGNFEYYVPIDTTNRGQNPATGPNKKVSPLEADACVHMRTTAGPQHIVRQSGSLLRWQLVNGTWVPYADDACGNDADKVAYLSALSTTSTQAEALGRLMGRIEHDVHITSDTLVFKVVGGLDITIPPFPESSGPTIRRGGHGWRNFAIGFVSAAAVGTATYFIFKKKNPRGPGVITQPPGPGVDTRPPTGG